MWFQITGSALILLAFVLAQFKKLNVTSKIYLIMNVAGSTILTIDAYHLHQWGFFLLEFVWALVSLFGLIKAVKKSYLN